MEADKLSSIRLRKLNKEKQRFCITALRFLLLMKLKAFWEM